MTVKFGILQGKKVERIPFDLSPKKTYVCYHLLSNIHVWVKAIKKGKQKYQSKWGKGIEGLSSMNRKLE